MMVVDSCTISIPVKHILKIAVVVAAVMAAALCALAEPVASLHATNYVNDFAGVLDAATMAQLNDLCKQVDEKAKAQIAVAIVKSLDGQEAVDYGVALYQAWGIGKKGSDRGALILLSTQDHKYWINVGYGLEGILPDGKVGGFGREMVPILRTGNYNAAVTLVTNRVAQVIAQDAGVTLTAAAQEPEYQYQTRPSNDKQGPGSILGIVVIVIIVIILLMFRGGRSLLWFLLGMMLGGGGGSRGGYGGGGGFGGGGFGGGGGGGFGGFGGGSTGGGGAGGSW